MGIVEKYNYMRLTHQLNFNVKMFSTIKVNNYNRNYFPVQLISVALIEMILNNPLPLAFY